MYVSLADITPGNVIQWLELLLLIFSIAGTVCGAAYYIGSKIGTINSSLNIFSERFHVMESDVSHIRARLDGMDIAQKQQSLKLQEHGKALDRIEKVCPLKSKGESDDRKKD